MDIIYLSWDSAFLGIKTGQLSLSDSTELEHIGNEIQNKDYKLIYIYSSNQLNDIENARVIFADRKVVYETGNYPNRRPNSNYIRVKKTEDTHDLIDLAYISGEFSRFKIDKNFPKGTFEKLYTIWLNESVNGNIADELFVYEQRGQIKGFVSVKIKKQFCIIGLIAVNESCQGEGIGSELYNAVVNYVFENNLFGIEVTTQYANKKACAFYEKVGFKIKTITNIYHYWL